MEKANMPEKKFRAGPVSATIWQNSGKSRSNEEYVFKSVSLERSYKDKEGNWKSAGSFRVNDLPRVKLVVDKAFEYLVLKAQGSSSEEMPNFVEEEMVM